MKKSEEELVQNVVNAFTKSLVSLEVIKTKELPESEEEAEEMYNKYVKHKTYIIDDLSEPYIIRLSYSDKKSKFRSVDPDFLNDADRYELSESIQEILKENGFPINQSQFDFEGDQNGDQ